MEQRAKQVAELLKVLANENRLLILCALLKEPKTVGEISEFVPSITQGALSQHLTLLKAHRILDSQKTGQHMTYFLADPRVEKVLDVIKEYYCKE